MSPSGDEEGRPRAAIGDPPAGEDDGDDRTDPRRIPPWVLRAIVVFWLGWLVVYYGTGAVQALRSLLLVLLVSVFLSFAIEPAVNRMERWGLRRADWVVFGAILVATAGFATAIGTALATQFNDLVDEVPGYLDDIEAWVNDTFDAEVSFDELRDEFVEGGGVEDVATRFADDIVTLGTTVLGLVLQVFTVALFTFYLVAEGPKLRETICSRLAPERQRVVLSVWDLAIEKTGGYIYSCTILAFLSGLAHWVAFMIIGVPFLLPLAVFVGVVSQFIPVVGTYIAGALPVLVAVLDQPLSGVWVLAVVVAYQQLENYVFAPRITAHTMEIHVAVAFGAVLAGGAILGVVGALLALPFTATVQAFASTFVQRHELSEEALAASRSRRGRVPWTGPARPG